MARKKRPDGRVQIQIDIGFDENGKRKRKFFYGATLTEARMRRDDWLDEQKNANAQKPELITLREWSKQWLESTKNTTEPSTYRQKKSSIKMQNSFLYGNVELGSIDVADIKPIHIQSYLNSLSGMSKGTIKYRRYVMHSLLDAAMANGIIERSPWLAIKAPKGTYAGHRDLDEQEQKLVLETWDKHRAGIWSLTMMYTGVRREECAALCIEDVDLKNEQIHIHAAVAMQDRKLKETKTEAGDRIVPIFPQLLEPLRTYIGERENGVLFTSTNGRQLNHQAFKRGWDGYMLMLERNINGIEPCDHTAGFRRDLIKKRFEEAGKEYKSITKFTAHDLRYTYATILYDAGVDVKTASYLLGHSDITVTMKIYTQLSSRKKLEGMDALKKYMREQYLPETDAVVTSTNN